MTAPYKWTLGFADAYASSYGSDVADYLRWVIEPSLAALEKRREELAQAAEDDSVFHFDLSDHVRLIRRTYMTFALAIQSLWEQQLRSYVTTCASGYSIEGVSPYKLESAKWGDELNEVFYNVRGLRLDGFDSYPALTQLQMLGNVCRHGAGESARRLHKRHPELWPAPLFFPWEKTERIAPPVEHIQISLELLTRYVSAVALFWLDIERHGLDSLVKNQPDLQKAIARLLDDRIPLLEVVTPSPRCETPAPSPRA